METRIGIAATSLCESFSYGNASAYVFKVDCYCLIRYQASPVSDGR